MPDVHRIMVEIPSNCGLPVRQWFVVGDMEAVRAAVFAAFPDAKIASQFERIEGPDEVVAALKQTIKPSKVVTREGVSRMRAHSSGFVEHISGAEVVNEKGDVWFHPYHGGMPWKV